MKALAIALTALLKNVDKNLFFKVQNWLDQGLEL